MGITISSKNKSIDLGCGGFYNLRTKVAELTNPELLAIYKELDRSFRILSSKERKTFFENYNKQIQKFDEDHDGDYFEILNFLYASDCDAEFDADHCKKIYEIIKDYDDNILYGYAGRKDCAKFSDFKEVILDGVNNDGIEWF